MKRIRRMSKSFIPLSLSSPELSELDKQRDIKKSKSESSLLTLDQNIEIEFEGDGPLGIIFENNDNIAYVKHIKNRTVASEEYKLKIGLKLIKIGSYDCAKSNYIDNMNLIKLSWYRFNKLKLTFEEIDSSSESDTEIEYKECPIYSFLERNNCQSYYKDFVLLGAKTLEDLSFIEYQDLINMKMSSEKRKKIFEEINFKKINVYFSPYLSKQEIKIEKQKYDSNKCIFIEIPRPN